MLSVYVTVPMDIPESKHNQVPNALVGTQAKKKKKERNAQEIKETDNNVSLHFLVGYHFSSASSPTVPSAEKRKNSDNWVS